jgi:ATP-dependent Clp protease ATP-binding subunit ClpX
LLRSYDSPYLRSKRFFDVMGIDLEIEDLAAALIAEHAAKDSRTGARSLRPIFSELVNALEFDPLGSGKLEGVDGNERPRLVVTAGMVRESTRRG